MMGIDVDRDDRRRRSSSAPRWPASPGVMVGLVFNQVFHLMGFVAGPEGLHGRGRRRDRQHAGRDARRPAHRAGRVLLHRLHLVDLPDLIVFAILIAVMLVRPTGCSARADIRRSERCRTVGVDEWVARSEERTRGPRRARGARSSAVAATRAAGRPRLASSPRSCALIPLLSLNDFHPAGRRQRAAAGDARARAQRRGRLGRAARPRLHRVLRLRRLRLRAAVLRPARRAGIHLPPLVVDPARHRRRGRRSACCSACRRGGCSATTSRS